jgi:hypothetical protein
MKMDKTLSMSRGDKFLSLKTGINIEVVDVFSPSENITSKWLVRISWVSEGTGMIKIQSVPMIHLQEAIVDGSVIRVDGVTQRKQKFSMTPVKFIPN